MPLARLSLVLCFFLAPVDAFLLLGPVDTVRTAAQTKRQVWAWVPHQFTRASQQLEANAELFDGIYLWCGLEVNDTNASRPSFFLGEDYWSTPCQDLVRKAKELNISLHMGISVDNSPKVTPVGLERRMDMSAIAESSIALAKQHGWGGFNLDDESQTCPRKDPVAFDAWVKNVDAWAAALQGAGLKLTVDVQSLTCSMCSPWPSCLHKPGSIPDDTLQLALKRTREMLGSSYVHRWIEMDTYYYNFDFFQTNLDWYSQWLIPDSKIGLGICPNHECNPTDANQTKTRLDAVERTSIAEIDIWRLPLDAHASEVWVPRLREWKHVHPVL